MNKLTEFIHENYNFDVWVLRLIDSIINQFSEDENRIEIIARLLEPLDIPREEIAENIE